MVQGGRLITTGSELVLLEEVVMMAVAWSVLEQANPVAILLTVAAVCSVLTDFVATQKPVQGALC
jgi:hypothetical protein